MRWRSGAADTLVVPRPLGRRTASGAIDLVRQQPDRSDGDLVTALAAAGFATATGRPFDVKAVRRLRRRSARVGPVPCVPGADDVTAREVATRLGVTDDVVYAWLAQGHLDADRDAHGRWRVSFSAEVEAACRQRVLASSRITPRVLLATGGAV